ncbi:antitoxin Xre/MbcA/ParS toxin-binding domain-containing protein [Cupriavidus sp. UYPR2.512]|uniref:antitoxin Xre/MbcA/ParS toxin-binding domain-containing protein n=1 Tax=Cupriavidus sp. UYPR2.512 TaxID=1080187 RepID=UPI001E416D6E|nr:antitoxin Xre/MbcA/ParS toxin-binding domain-containing protein [Cupriavidus sp. UYPR2.512]
MQPIDHFGTNGFGAQPQDFEMFDMLDLSEQCRVISAGMEAAVLERLAKDVLNVPLLTLVKSLKLAPSTVQRRLKGGRDDSRLSPAESDRVARVLIILKIARDLFGDDKRAVEWIKRPLAPLGHKRPIEMLDTQPGYDRVRDVLLHASEGVMA